MGNVESFGCVIDIHVFEYPTYSEKQIDVINANLKQTTHKSAPLKTDGIFDMKALTVLTATPVLSACIRSTIVSI